MIKQIVSLVLLTCCVLCGGEAAQAARKGNPAAPKAPLVLVLPYQVNVGPEMSNLNEELPQLISERLKTQGLRVVSMARARSLLRQRDVETLDLAQARALAEALGLTVAWDGANSTVVLAHPQPEVTPPAEPGLAAPSSTSSNPEPEYGPGTPGWTGDSNTFESWHRPEQQQTTAQHVLNTKSLKIHYSSCREVPKIAPQNYLESNESIDSLFNQGYTYCGVCHK